MERARPIVRFCTGYYRPALIALALAAIATSWPGCGLGIEVPVDPATYAGCWRFQVRLATSDRLRDFIDRDFVIEISPVGELTRVLMRREGERTDDPFNLATFVELISPQAAATLQNSFFADRISADPADPNVQYSGDIDATTSGFSITASISLLDEGVTRYALAVDVRVDGDEITDVDGLFIDQPGASGRLLVRELLTGANRAALRTDCPANIVQPCDRFFDTTIPVMTSRIMAYDAAHGLAGQVIASTDRLLQFFDLATGEIRFTVALPDVVLGRMAIDGLARRVYVPTRDEFGVGALLVISLEDGFIHRTIQLKRSGCVDRNTVGSAALIAATGEVLVCTANASNAAFDGVIRVDPLSGLVMGALQNVHLTDDPFSQPRDMVVLDAANVAVVANAGANRLTLVPLDSVTRELRGGDTPECQNDTAAGTLVTAATEGAFASAIAADDESRGIILLQGTTATSADGRYQTWSVTGSGAAAALTVNAGVGLSRRTFPFGVDVDSQRNEAFIVNADVETVRVNLTTGASPGTIGNIAGSDILFVTAITGRNRLMQADGTTIIGEYCLP